MELRTVLLVAQPGTTEIRLAAERELRRRAWPLAPSPAAADLLILCGPPPIPTPPWLATLHTQLPPPRTLVALHTPDQAATGLLAHPVHLEGQGAEHPAQRPAQRPAEHAEDEGHSEHAAHEEHREHEGPHSEHGEHGGHEDPHSEHGGHGQHGGHGDHGNHGDHGGHAGHHMEGMAERGDDRDGLRLDRWELAYGPGLADWPAGLVLRVVMQGDVVQEAVAGSVDGVPGSGAAYWHEPWLRAARGAEVTCGEAARRRCGARLDSLGRLLAVAGWADQAARARRLRDAVLAATASRPVDPTVLGALSALTRRVRRSRTLRWLTRGLGQLPAARVRALGVSGPAMVAASEGAGDVYDRIRVWLDETDGSTALFTDTGPLPPDSAALPQHPPSAPLLAALPEMLAGAEFACARLVLASLDPDLDDAVPAPAHAHGHPHAPAPAGSGPSHG
ncbi:hypothetical protein [Streptomyces iconiensis]|uniref:Uncharacterized protein n=1 Tax=Streptomyces iconiensis TaxID=1384038 RepID=A0ABT7A9F4_9ACTN|nr:hypothetical protein [Streptomyces iconiensis]MDJ1137955.1 hypothetical protein [Streptomyces iconiensis]